jgi:TFIIF-interacting CTD phosphatase-like protein
MDICCDPLEKDLIIEVRFGLDTDKTFRYCYKKTYSANFLTSDISKIKNAVDKVVYLNNLMFKKVMTVKDFHIAIKAYGWTIKKGGIDSCCE